MSGTTNTAVRAADFTNSIGVNTHLDFGGTYSNLSLIEADIKYLGVTNLRDSAATDSDAQTWQQVAQATGAKFDDFIGETSVADMSTQLARMPTLAGEGILNFIEGGNEEDDAFAQNLGNTLAATAAFQQQISAMGQTLNLPTINMSFGAGWTAANDWHGDYDKVGNLSAFATYANAHTYPAGAPALTIQQLNADANIAAVGNPVINTEFGYDTNTTDPTQAATWTLDGLLDAFQDGDVKTYLYALIDDGSGAFGLMNADGTPKPAGLALHDMMSLLSDTGSNAASFTTASLNYTLSGTQSGDNSMLMQKSDGTYWLAVWNESVSSHTITLNLGSAASQIDVFQPLTSTNAVQQVSGATSINVTVPNSPVLIEIVPNGTTPPAGGSGDPSGGTGSDPSGGTGTGGTGSDPSGGTGTGGTGSDPSGGTGTGGTGSDPSGGTGTGGTGSDPSGGTGTGGTGSDPSGGTGTGGTGSDPSGGTGTGGTGSDPSGGTGTGGTGGGNTGMSSNDTTVTVPGTQTVASATATGITGVSVTDPWAAQNPGTLALNLTDISGQVSMTDASGNPVAGSGTSAIHLQGTLAQLNADLASLTFTGTSSDTITVDVWNQAGVETDQTIGIAINGATGGNGSGGNGSGGNTGTGGSGSTGPTGGNGSGGAGTGTGGTGTGGTGGGNTGMSSNDTTITVPATQTVASATATAITGVSVTDPWAAQNPGTLALNLTDISGQVSMTDASGNPVAGSGTSAIHLQGTLAQLNADLASLTFTGTSSDTITVDVWNQAGVETDQTIGVAIGTPTGGSGNTGGSGSTGPTDPTGGNGTVINGSGDTTIVAQVNGTTVNPGAGNMSIYLNSTGNTVTAGDGNETIFGFNGGNHITTGNGNNVVAISGSGSVVATGTGANTIADSGSNNTIVLPAAGQGTDSIYGNVLQNGDTLDLTKLLQGTTWNQDASTLGNFVHVALNGSDTVISVSDSGNDAGIQVATLFGANVSSLATVLSHATT